MTARVQTVPYCQVLCGSMPFKSTWGFLFVCFSFLEEEDFPPNKDINQVFHPLLFYDRRNCLAENYLQEQKLPKSSCKWKILHELFKKVVPQYYWNYFFSPSTPSARETNGLQEKAARRKAVVVRSVIQLVIEAFPCWEPNKPYRYLW